jgi:short-subunit dehydrogenase
MSFTNQVAVITGASSGIGWELAKVLAAQGAAVGLIARRGDRLEALANEIRQAGGKAAWAVADVSQREPTLAAIHKLRQELGPIDLLVANSGVSVPTLIEPINVVEVEGMFKVNVLGVLYAFEAVLPEMLQRGRGHLAAVSSLASYKGLPGESGYCATKAALNIYLEGLRIRLRDRGIAVTTICPGFIDTPMIATNTWPMPWMMSAAAAARRIAHALRRKKKVYNFPLRTTLLIKMTRWLPDWLLNRVLRRYTYKSNQAPVV